jgi:hypothetical protein
MVREERVNNSEKPVPYLLQNETVHRSKRYLRQQRPLDFTVRESEGNQGNKSSAGDRLGLDSLSSALRIKYVVDPPIVSGGGASTSDDSEPRKVLVIRRKENMARPPAGF